MSQSAKHICIVEDEKSLRDALHQYLTKRGYTVDIAENGAVALDVVKNAKPDLILLDILMPIKDGMSFLADLRASDWGSELPVIILTNVNNMDKIAMSVEHGIFNYMLKADSTLESIVERIESTLARA